MSVVESRFRVRLVAGAYPGLDAVHLTPIRSVRTTGAIGALGFTRRQSEILALALDGHGTASIAERLQLSPRTVEKHFENIYVRLGVHSRGQAIIALTEGLER